VFNFSREGLRRSLGESLKRLQLDRIDIAFVHDPDDHLDQAIEAVGGLIGLGAELGVGTNQVETAIRFVRRTAVQHVLIAGRYTLLDRSADHELLPLCAERGIRVTVGGVFNSGLLAGGTTFDYRPAPPGVVTRARQPGVACGRHGVPLPTVALQLSLRHPAISTVLIGPRAGRRGAVPRRVRAAGSEQAVDVDHVDPGTGLPLCRPRGPSPADTQREQMPLDCAVERNEQRRGRR